MSLAEILYIEHSNIDIDRQFIDMGMDSIIGVEWIKVVNKQYGISIKATKIYAYPTIRDFAEFLQEELTKQGDCVADSPETFVSSEYETKEPVYLAQSNLVKSLQKELVMSLAEILYMEHSNIDIDRQFIDMGMDSIIGVEWIKAINIQYGVSIKATKIYAYPTIRDFAEFLQEELTKQDDRFSDSPETFVSNESKTKEPVSSLSVGKKIDFEVPTQNLSIVQKPVHLVQSNSVESLQKELIMSLAEILYIEHSNIDIDRRFIDMGMDSIIGVEWIKVVNKQYGISIKATKIYDYPTVRNFAEFLQKELNKRKQELNQLSPQSNLSINNLDEILLQVAHGTLDIKLADQLLQNLQIKE
nr:acyl carrier protein [Bacillus cereus]